MKRKLLEKLIDLALLVVLVTMALFGYDIYLKIRAHDEMTQTLIEILKKQSEAQQNGP